MGLEFIVGDDDFHHICNPFIRARLSERVMVGQEFTKSISVHVCNGLCLGCTMAPVLFSLYFGAVVDDWRSRCSVAAVRWS